MGSTFDAIVSMEKERRARLAQRALRERQGENRTPHRQDEAVRSSWAMRVRGVPVDDQGLSFSDDEAFAAERLRPSQVHLDPEDLTLTHGVPTEALYDSDMTSESFMRIREDVETDSEDILAMLTQDAPLDLQSPVLYEDRQGELDEDGDAEDSDAILDDDGEADRLEREQIEA